MTGADAPRARAWSWATGSKSLAAAPATEGSKRLQISSSSSSATLASSSLCPRSRPGSDAGRRPPTRAARERTPLTPAGGTAIPLTRHSRSTRRRLTCLPRTRRRPGRRRCCGPCRSGGGSQSYGLRVSCLSFRFCPCFLPERKESKKKELTPSVDLEIIIFLIKKTQQVLPAGEPSPGPGPPSASRSASR